MSGLFYENPEDLGGLLGLLWALEVRGSLLSVEQWWVNTR